MFSEKIVDEIPTFIIQMMPQVVRLVADGIRADVIKTMAVTTKFQNWFATYFDIVKSHWNPTIVPVLS